MEHKQHPTPPDDHGPFGLVTESAERPTEAPKNWTNFFLLMVPLFLQEMRHLSEDEANRLQHEAVDMIAAHGDDAQYGGAHRAEARTVLAKALALAARADGGVTAFGIHACTQPHIACPGRFNSPSATTPTDADEGK